MDKLIDALASDETMLANLEELYRQVYTRLSEEYGESNMMSGQEGLWSRAAPTQQEQYA